MKKIGRSVENVKNGDFIAKITFRDCIWFI